MSRENVENVRARYEALNRRDWDAVFRDQHPDFEPELTTPPGPHAGTYRGREEIQGYLESWITAFDAWTVEPEEIFESGDQLVVFLKTRARPEGSSAEIEVRNGHLWTLKDGKVVSTRLFPEPEKALEAAGLRE
jgi:ketosteroid isomerase-like protein